MANSIINCPRVSGLVQDFGTEHPEKYRESVLLLLRQFWKGPEVLPVEKGSACVGAAAEGLSFYVCYTDSDIFSTATADNQKMWKLGDVVEFFVKPGAERSDYWEIHVTPNHYLMDICIPDRERMTQGKITWDEVLAPDSKTQRHVEVFEGRWAVEVCIPWPAFGVDTIPGSGTTWSFAVCRYNYNDGLDNPEHSSTANLTELAYDRWEEYTDLRF